MDKQRPIVEISDGKLKGTLMQTYDGETVYSFLGIPYGKSPIGEQRFRVSPLGIYYYSIISSLLFSQGKSPTSFFL